MFYLCKESTFMTNVVPDPTVNTCPSGAHRDIVGPLTNAWKSDAASEVTVVSDVITNVAGVV